MTRITIDPARPVGRLDRKVFGGFVEHLGRCIYGGLYDEGSPLSDDRGFRKDVLGLLRELGLGVLRWPGGNGSVPTRLSEKEARDVNDRRGRVLTCPIDRSAEEHHPGTTFPAAASSGPAAAVTGVSTTTSRPALSVSGGAGRCRPSRHSTRPAASQREGREVDVRQVGLEACPRGQSGLADLGIRLGSQRERVVWAEEVPETGYHFLPVLDCRAEISRAR